MEKPNRKITWVHVTYMADGDIIISFVTERWRKAKYLGKRRRDITLKRRTWNSMSGLLRVVKYSPDHRYTIVSWDGWSVCFERLFS